MTQPLAGRKKLARRTDLAASVVAGTAGASLGAVKLRDAHREQYGEQHVARGVQGAAKVAGRLHPTRVKRLTEVAEHGKPGFKTLAIGSAAAAVATGASRYQDHVTRKQKRLARIAKADWGEDMAKIPRVAHIRGIGRVRVLGYHGNNQFRVLDSSDSERIVHRNKLTFIKPKEAAVSKSAFGVTDERPEVVAKAFAFTEKGKKRKAEDRELASSVPRGKRMLINGVTGVAQTAKEAPKGKKLKAVGTHARHAAGRHGTNAGGYAKAKQRHGF